MGRDFGYEYEGEPVFRYVKRDVPAPPTDRLDDELYLFVMGPYTAFDARYAYDDGEKLDSPFIEDPLFDPDEHVRDDGRGTMESALADLCSEYRERFGVHAFLASDVESVPTEERAESDEDGMSVLDQSIAFAAVSDAVVFIFTQAGLTTGVGSEVGAVLGEFNLRERDDRPERKPRERFRIFCSPSCSSASIREASATYGVDDLDFETREQLIRQTRAFLVNIRRDDPDRPLPLFDPHDR